MLRAKSENVSPKDITDRYHNEFKECFDTLGFSFDKFNRTDDEFHIKHVQEIVKKFFHIH